MLDKIFCIGEVLWGSLPEGLFLGGAPFNVASKNSAIPKLNSKDIKDILAEKLS